MYSVIVVDDETWILKLIRKIVDWEAFGFQVIADASDGKKALELIVDKKPDLVITDIRMPSLDGIGLIKATRELEIDSEFVIISGYSDFEYARCAVTYDAFGYLLKPLGKKEFSDVLQRAGERISQKYMLKKKIEDSDMHMLENDIKRVISGIDCDVSIGSLNIQYGTGFEDGVYCAVIFNQDFYARTHSAYDNSEYLRFLADMKERHSAQFTEMVFFSGNIDNQVILILNVVKDDVSVIKAVLHDILAECESRPAFSSMFQLTICIGPRMNDFKAISESYNAAAEAMKARGTLGQGRVIDTRDVVHRLEKVKGIIALKDVKKLARMFDVFDIDGAMAEIKDILTKAQNDNPLNAIIYHLAAYEIIELLFSSMEKKGIHNSDGVPVRQQAKLCVDNCVFRAQIEEHLKYLLGEFAGIHAKSRHDGGDQLIAEIKAYIAENYMSDISLDEVAKRVCLNPTYVSEVFKKKTGENFSEHIIDYRIDIAKDLLKDVRYKIIDISNMVGYKDSKYFSRLFKKKVGVNPTDYRKLYV